MKPAAGPFRILSLSGGGFRGLYTAEVLTWLESELGRPLHECFDLVAGTSTGGILAIGIATGKPAGRLSEAFDRHGPSIFGSDRPARSKLAKGAALAENIRAAKYSSKPLRDAIEEMIGTQDAWSDLKTHLLVPAVSLLSGGPQFFRSYRMAPDQHDITLSEVAMATSAAPTYFPTAQVGNRTYVDGGLVANAPDLVAVSDAEAHLGIRRSRIRLAAIGTTGPQPGEAIVVADKRGLADWDYGRKVVELTLASQEALARELARRLLGERNTWLLDHIQSKEQQAELALDCASPQASALLSALATQTAEQARLPAWLRSVIRKD